MGGIGKGIEVLSLMSLIKIDEHGNLIMHNQLRDFGREIVHLQHGEKPQKQSRLWIYEEAIDVLDNNKMAIEFKVLNLTSCRSLRRTPDLSTFESLEILILQHCENLEEIHPSVRDIKTLISLDVHSCRRLKELPAELGKMVELRELPINDTDIQEIPISRGCLMKLETLCISNCKRFSQLPESMSSLISLTLLELSNLEIEELPEFIGSLEKLKTLDASSCRRLAQLPKSMGYLVSSTLLNLSSSIIKELPKSIGSMKEL
ncbi:hypothetical protein BT93_B1264 [Corymbia citriodora subsp. variegata]|nr:hypothetical protein BT93_B1264 [Corymbia citriodora subsp. variegata]